MNRSKIEWTDYTWNPITGCSRKCGYPCYARMMAYRLRGRFGYPRDDPFKVTFHPNRLHEPSNLIKASKIFVCSMGEMFDKNIDYKWIFWILDEIGLNPHHTFQILSKCYTRISKFVYPDNVWLGVSIDGRSFNDNFFALRYLNLTNAKVKYVSYEPLLSPVKPILKGIDWIIIGAKTGVKPFQPKKQWVENLTHIAKENNIPVFHKNNLKHGWLKEFPKHDRSFK